MTNNQLPKTEANENQANLPLTDIEQQITLTREGDKIILSLPPPREKDRLPAWNRMIEDFKFRLQGMEKSWLPRTAVHLQSNEILLDNRQLKIIAELLHEVQLELKLVVTSRRQTAVAAASAGYSVQQESAPKTLLGQNRPQTSQLAQPLYLKTTLRSGVEIRHPGMVVILGDVNPGATIIAAGDVFIWGTLRGIAHAGARGNRQCLIMALRMEPTQVRIANLVARTPDNSPEDLEPEVACITPQGIRITPAVNFVKTNTFSLETGSWTNFQKTSLI
jgi:septum site-determining protein MinC